MTEKELIDLVQIKTKIDKKTIGNITWAIIREIKYEVKLNKQVSIRGFGTFAPHKRPDGTNKPGFTPAKAWIEAKSWEV